MTEILVFPDIEAAFCDYIGRELPGLGFAGVPVVNFIPDPRPLAFVRANRTGGPRDSLVLDHPQVSIDAWGASDEYAHDLAQAARALIHVMPWRYTPVSTYAVAEFSGPQNSPDPGTGTSRYTFTVSLLARGKAFAQVQPGPGFGTTGFGITGFGS